MPLAAYLDSLKNGPRSRKNSLSTIKAFLGWAEDRELIVANPAARVKVRIPKAEKPPQIFKPEQTRALLGAADPKLIPYLAIGLFAGLRPAEINRLTWDKIDLERGFIEVTAKNAKTRKRRLVDTSQNLKTWLEPFAKVAGKV